MIKIVNIRNDKCDVYCGHGSPLGNKFFNGIESERNFAIYLFKEWFYLQEKIGFSNEIRNQLNEIKILNEKGIVKLGCYCVPKRCHCEVIKEYVENNMI